MSATTSNERESTSELRGSVLDVLVTLLNGHAHSNEIIALVSKLVARNGDLEKLVATLRAGKNRGEHIAPEQLDIFLDKLRAQAEGDLAEANRKLEDAAEENGGRPEPVNPPPKQPPVRRPPPPGLRRVDNPIKVPDEERACPACGAARTCICVETTEVIDLIPAEVIVRRDQREILACNACDAEVVRAPMGDKVVAGGAYGSRLVAKLVVGKYWDSMPLHRQGQELERLGLSMPSSSMGDQIEWATDLLRPLWRQLLARALGAIVLHVDATNLPVRDKETDHQVVVGSLWGYVADREVALYLYTSTGKKLGQRPGEMGPEDLLTHRRGYVVADAAQIFDKSFKRADLIEVGCNMHARRYFVKAFEAKDARASVPLKAFQALYDIEASVTHASDEARLAARLSRSRPIYAELVAWCEKHRPLEPPSSLLAVAIRYLTNHRIALMRFLDDGVLPIDNGIVERLHRRPAIGRRNFLFAGSHAGGERAAIAYSILATCHLIDVNPLEYLADVLPRLARGGIAFADMNTLLPAAWKRARDAAATRAASTAI